MSHEDTPDPLDPENMPLNNPKRRKMTPEEFITELQARQVEIQESGRRIDAYSRWTFRGLTFMLYLWLFIAGADIVRLVIDGLAWTTILNLVNAVVYAYIVWDWRRSSRLNNRVNKGIRRMNDDLMDTSLLQQSSAYKAARLLRQGDIEGAASALEAGAREAEVARFIREAINEAEDAATGETPIISRPEAPKEP